MYSETSVQSFRRAIAGKLIALLPESVRSKLSVHLGKPDLRFTLLQLRRFGFRPGNVLDVGAYLGDWTRLCLDVWPDASAVCVEPQQGAQDSLQKLSRSRAPKVIVKQGLLGDADRTDIPFLDSGTGSSVLARDPPGSLCVMWRIDTLIDQGMALPDLVKIDTQGYELAVLSGFERHLQRCKVLQVELSLLPIVPGAAMLHEVVAYLYQRGFVLFDIEEFIRSPSDGAMWQIDAIFCREDSPLRLERTWR
jgi:FkbM family methyltransferase